VRSVSLRALRSFYYRFRRRVVDHVLENVLGRRVAAQRHRRPHRHAQISHALRVFSELGPFNHLRFWRAFNVQLSLCLAPETCSLKA